MKTQLTQEGLEKLQSELETLSGVKRAEAVQRLSRARAMGDLSENSEYQAAKEDLGVVEGRIQELNAILKDAVVVSSDSKTSNVSIGSTVTVEVNGASQTFSIVGEFEADPMNKKLSASSPIGSALIKKKVGDTVEVHIPAGKTNYKIIDIQ